MFVFVCVWAHFTHNHIPEETPAPSPPLPGFESSVAQPALSFSQLFLCCNFHLPPPICCLLCLSVSGSGAFSYSPVFNLLWLRLQWCRLFWGRRCREFYSDLQNRGWWSSSRLKSLRTEDISSVSQVNSLDFNQVFICNHCSLSINLKAFSWVLLDFLVWLV